MAQPFDVARLTTSGDAAAIAEQVAGSANSGFVSAAVSNTGILFYRTASATLTTQLVWFDRGGTQLSIRRPPGRT
jgi:energy-converting hydrogenase Eha subunit G